MRGVIAVFGAMLAMAGTAGAAHPCAAATAQCEGTIAVPLDWSDPSSGRINVAFGWVPRRDRSRPATGTILFGGPSRANAQGVGRMLGPVLDRQNLLIVDPRGLFESSPLACKGLDTRRPVTIRACARRLGPRVQFFSSDQIAGDMNAVRQALGIPALTVYGGSSGTLYAQAFASRFPAQTAAVFLDSVIATRRDGYATWAVSDNEMRLGVRGFAQVCRSSDPCRLNAGRPRELLARLVRRLRARPDRRVPLGALSYVVYYPDDAVFGRELIAAAGAYLRGDRAPLRRLGRVGARENARSVDSVRVAELAGDIAADCADNALPFDRYAGPRARRRQLDDFYAKRRPAAPFSMDEAFGMYGGHWADACVHWPILRASPPVPPGAGYPAVPMLAVGEQLDANTPASNAAKVAARFPRSTVVQVPFAGHLSSNGGSGPYSRCVNRLMRSFLARPRHPMPRPRCSGETYRAIGSFPRASTDGRRIAATFATLADAVARRHPQSRITAGLRREPGLRGGMVRFDDKNRIIRLERVRFVADLAVTGTIRLRAGDRVTAIVRLGGDALRIRWRAFRAEDSTRVTGSLNGRAFSARIPLH